MIVVLFTLGLVGCSLASSQTAKQQSTFKQQFSIGSLVEDHQNLLMEGPRTLSGMEAGPPEPFKQSHEYLTLQVDSKNIATLMEALQSDITASINTSGATIVGNSGSDTQINPIAYFSYDYREGSFYGVINVWGLRGEGTTFTIISQITESQTQNK
jgi:hypothetical protein